MKFLENELYHIYNRGNNKQKIFFRNDNYLYFLDKIRTYIQPYCDLLAWCLLPNHFHFLIHSDFRTIQTRLIGKMEKNVLSEGIRLSLSNYTQGINNQNKRTGSLFQQNTKAKLVSKLDCQYGINCLHYIHQNPVRAGLVKRMEDWEYSSFKDYCGKRNETLTNKEAAKRILNLDLQYFYEASYRYLNESNPLYRATV